MVKREARKAPRKQADSASTAQADLNRIAKKEAERAKMVEWLEENDPLYDRSGAAPITVSELLSTKLPHRTFTVAGQGEMPYDWTKFRTALEQRTASSPRWFMQLREEDLLIEGGLDGVTVDCVVIAEASLPTLSPAYYIVRTHLPYSDMEDNAPERILPIEGQGMCWRRVVRDNGGDINAFLLQKRETGSAAAPNFGFGTAPQSSAAQTNNSPAVTTSTSGFGAGFGATVPAGNNAAPPNFGFGAPAEITTTAVGEGATPGKMFGFGFGFGAASASSAAVAPSGFSFGTPANGDADSQATMKVAPLKPSEVLFALWTKKRLSGMMKSFKSGSRIVRESFKPSSTAPTIKLVMQNDLKDDVSKTVKQLILNKMFAKHSDAVKEVDRWIDKCPVYDEQLTPALQKFRAKYVQKMAQNSDVFQAMYDECHEGMEVELRRIVKLRKAAVQEELDRIDVIMHQLREGKLAEKQTFRLLKYYAANDIMRFRPFGKVSGISEMGESADVCEPPAPVLVNALLTSRRIAP